MSKNEKPNGAPPPADSDDGVSPDDLADMSAEDSPPALAEGGEAAMGALVEKAKTAPGSVFETETVRALVHLAKTNLPAWINLRARLKNEARDVPISELDKRLMLNGDDDCDDDGRPGAPLVYDEIEPWDERVNGATLLTELSREIGAYVVMDQIQRDAVALWAVFAHAHDFFICAALLIILSPTKRCGKTKLQEVLAKLVPRPQTMSGVSAAALARLVEKHRPTVLIDEFDAAESGNREMAESLRGQLNSSFNRNSAHVLKSVPLPAGGWDVRKFSTWAPTCIAGIGRVPDTVADRSVIIRLTRKLGRQVVKRLRARDGGELLLLARKIARFVADNEHRLRREEPDVPKELNDRARDGWEPLIAIADIAGDDWPERARKASTILAGMHDAEAAESDVRQTLLSDIRDIFAKEFPKGHPDHEDKYGPRLATKRLLVGLHKVEERSWSAFGKARTPLTDGARRPTQRLRDMLAVSPSR